MSRSLLSLLLLLLLSLCCAVATAGTVTISPQVRHVQQAAVRSSSHLTFSLDAHHRSDAPTTSFQPLSHTSSRLSSRFTTMQYNQATANMTGCSSIDFSALVTIGTQGPYRLIVDTGSTTLAVVSSSCTTCDSAHPTYTPTAGSQTNSDESFTSVYGGGTNWTGNAYTAKVAVGNSNSVSMIIATIDENGGFIDGADVCHINQNPQVGLNTSQGIIGFAYPSLAIADTDSWITKYVASTGVSNEFTLQMCDTGGNLWVGGYDTAFMNGPFTYVPIIKPNYYAVNLTDISVQTIEKPAPHSLGFTQAEYGPCVTQSNQDCTIVDSGTSLIQLPVSAYNALYNYIEADSYYQSIFGSNGISQQDPLDPSGQCALVTSDFPSLAELQANLPNVSFTFGVDSNDAPITVTIKSIPGYLRILYSDTPGQTYYCSGIAPTGAATILGYAFISQFTMRHDLTNQRIGMAETAQCGVAAPWLPNYQWTVGAWGECSVSSCGGVQWRSVDCTDLYGVKHPDIRCGNGYTPSRPADSQTCNTATCSAVTAAQFSSVTASSSVVQQGQTVSISYSYTGTENFISLFVTSNLTSVTQRQYIARNASGGTGSGVYSWYVPSTLPAGTYQIGAYTASNQGSDTFLASVPITVAPCTSGPCLSGMDVCNATTCGGRGECDIVNNTAVCSCVSAYNGTNCQTLVACTTQCINGGTIDLSGCSCSCPSGYTGSMCEQIYAVINATLDVSPSSIASSANAAAFQLAFITDMTYALGLRPDAVVIQWVGTLDGVNTVVTFQINTMGSVALLQSYTTLLGTLVSDSTSATSSSALSTGLTSASITSFAVQSGPSITPPGDGGDGGSASSDASKYWPYIVGAAGGFVVIFFVLYIINGGRCGCRRVSKPGNMTHAPKGSVSVNPLGPPAAHSVNSSPVIPGKHVRKPTHEPRHSYFNGTTKTAPV